MLSGMIVDPVGAEDVRNRKDVFREVISLQDKFR